MNLKWQKTKQNKTKQNKKQTTLVVKDAFCPFHIKLRTKSMLQF